MPALRELKDTRWVFIAALTASAYLLNFYADVYLYLSRPPGLIVFIGEGVLAVK